MLGRPSDVRATRVAETWVGGRPVWVRGSEAARIDAPAPHSTDTEVTGETR